MATIARNLLERRRKAGSAGHWTRRWLPGAPALCYRLRRPEVHLGNVSYGRLQPDSAAAKGAGSVRSSRMGLDIVIDGPVMTAAHVDRPMLPPGDYVSSNLQTVRLDDAFPEMIVGNISLSDWSYPRGGIVHNWYVDRRNPTVGFLNRDEASILYNTALMFAGRPCLEIGCWRGWSTAHFALGSGGLEVIDPVLQDPAFRKDVMSSLQRAGVLDCVTRWRQPRRAGTDLRQHRQALVDGFHRWPPRRRRAAARR
jgi:hypothetical protein